MRFFIKIGFSLEHNPYPLPTAIFGYYYSAVYSCQLPVFCAKQSICTTFTKRRVARRKIITPRGWFSREQASNGAKENCLAASNQLSRRVSIVVWNLRYLRVLEKTFSLLWELVRKVIVDGVSFALVLGVIKT